jgi:asparagine synthase (glutamine-hydrolysing)
MGALFGVVGLPPAASQPVIARMQAAASFRGDERTDHLGDGFAFAAALWPGERGPCLVSNESGSVVAACEGELYNAQDLATTLGLPAPAAEGFAVVPALFERHGKDFPRLMNGAFTIALFDVANRTLYLVRDHAGSHSLFYATSGANVSCATTTRALFAAGLVKPDISAEALDGYFACFAVSPPDTVFRGVMAVRPGHTAVIRDGAASEYAYWPFDACTEDRARSESDFADELRSVFVDAVKIRALHPGRYGALISGGVDTSAIAMVLLQNVPPGVLPGFSIVFDEQAYSDAALQEHVYRLPGMERHQSLLTPEAFREGLIAGAEHLDSPVNDVAYVGMYKAMELVKRTGLDAAFEGEGSDEIFCTGHSHGERSVQRLLAVPQWLRRATFGAVFRGMPWGPSFFDKARRFGCRLGMPTHERLSTWAPVMHNPMRTLLHPGTTVSHYPYPQTRYYLSTASVRDPINRYNYLLSRLFLADDLLYKNERMAAAHGVMNRTPFVDYRLMELGFKVPARFKIQKPTATQDMTKLIFKKAMKGIVPDPILERKKSRGFSQPTSVWYRGALKNFVGDLLLDPTSKTGSHLDRGEIRRIFDLHASGTANLDYHLNSLIVLELWMRANA